MMRILAVFLLDTFSPPPPLSPLTEAEEEREDVRPQLPKRKERRRKTFFFDEPLPPEELGRKSEISPFASIAFADLRLFMPY